MAKEKSQYKNAFWDIYDFLQGLRKQLGYNTTISIIQEGDEMVVGFHFQAIPHMQDVKAYEIHFDIPKDFQEPTDILAQVILDHVRAYIKSGGTAANVHIDDAARA